MTNSSSDHKPDLLPEAVAGTLLSGATAGNVARVGAIKPAPTGKAGAYAVQGRAAAFISSISGSYSGIMGLPMFETAQLLRHFGIPH